MSKLLKIALASALVLGVSVTTASADAAKGQKLFSKFLKGPCGMTGAKFAAKKTQDGWDKVKGNFEAEVIKICPNVKAGEVKGLEHIFDFARAYASDSGNVPSC
jgi:hypothetical protein